MFLPPEATGRRYYRQTFNLSLFYNGRSGQLLFWRSDAYPYSKKVS